MSAVRPYIDQLFRPSSEPPEKIVGNLVQVCLNLPLDELQELIRELSFILYEKEEMCRDQLITMEFLKALLLTGSFPCYLLVNVYICEWLLSINDFYKNRALNKRAELFYRDAMGTNVPPNARSVQSYRQMLQFAEEFLVFFGQNLKYHPYSKYKIKNKLYRRVKEGSFSRSLEWFVKEDKSKLQKNLSQYSPEFREHLKSLTQFLSDKVEECLTNPAEYQNNSFLLLGLIEMSQSYSISTILYRTCRYLVRDYILNTCQFLNSIYSLGQIEAIEIANSKCLPLILEYLLPIDIKDNQVLPAVKYNLDRDTLNKLVDFYHIWKDKTKLAGLSTQIYQYSYEMVSWLKKPNKLSYQYQIQQFTSKLNKMKESNDIKRPFVADQNKEIQKYVVKLLKEAQFCLDSQKRQKVAFQNVLDELTLSENDGEKMSQFSQSMLKSSHMQSEENNRKWNGLLGPPRKKFSKADSSISEILRSRRKSPRFSNINLSRQSKEESSQNIYYDKSEYETVKNKDHYKTAMKFFPFQKQITMTLIQQSQHYIPEQSAKIVMARNSNTPQKTPASSPHDSIFLHSSQFSQKDNNQQEIQSVYLNKDNFDEDSGQFINFDKKSIANSEKEIVAQPISKQYVDSEIQFEDSVKLKNSQSLEVLEYGIDKDAKLPPTLKKPKFGFKQCETNDSSLILKDLNLSQQKSSKEKPLEEVLTPVHTNPIKSDVLKEMSPQDKKTPHTGVPQEGIRSSNHSSELKFSKKMSQPRKEQKIQNIYLRKSIEEDQNSQIRPVVLEPCADSGLQSQSDSIPSNFSGMFRRNKSKREKASSIRSSRSLRKIKVAQKPVEMPDFRKMRELQMKLGELKKETQNVEQVLTQKEKEKTNLQTRRKELAEENPYFLKRQNEIIKQLLNHTNKKDNLRLSHSSARSLTKQLRESSVKNYNMNLKDYNPNVLKLKLENIKGYQKQAKKHIVANRCFLLNNELLEVGYSLKQRTVTLYFTLKHYCEELQINLNQNSMIFSDSIDRQFNRILVDKQIKFKTDVETTKNESQFKQSTLNIKISFEEQMRNKVEEYSLELPLTPYNIATPINTDQSEEQSFSKEAIVHYITPLYNSCQDLLKKGKTYLEHLFPHGQFDEESNSFIINYVWKERNQKVRIKLKERAFRIEGTGHPTQTGRELIETIINLLVDPSS